MTWNWDPSQEEIREMARAFTAKHVDPVSQQLDRRPPEFPEDVYQAMAKEGFMGYPSAPAYGGQGKNKLLYATLIEEISYADPAIGIVMAVQVLASYPIEKFGTEEQKKKYLTRMNAGELHGAFALTEPNAGSDAAAQEATATLDGDHYILNGEKIFITSGNVADVVVVICKANTAEAPDKFKVSALIFDNPDDPGYSTEILKYKMGIRASTTARLYFKDVKVPKENLLGDHGKGFRIALNTLDGARVGVAAQSLGICQKAFDLAQAYAKEREQFGSPIAKLQAIQWMIADMSCRLEAARLLTYKAAVIEASGEPVGLQAAQAKLYASEAANFCVDKCMQIHAGYGYIGDFSRVEQLYRDQRITEIYEGTSEVQRLVIAGHLLR
ncbi:MAG: acyl-CoA dehydrogenase family protein [Candidatus Zixiibacteriota bacterium]|jgi:butyryl-CoA dehydrogenase